MKISVIIPAFNEEKYLSKTLEAILAQDYPDFEVILVDNGSTDRTSEIAQSFQGVKVLYESRKGTMWACEKGLQEAKGDIIVRMDADCVPPKDWLSKGAAHFLNKRVVAVTGPYDYFDAGNFSRYLSLYFQKYIYSLTNSALQLFRIGAVMIGGNSFMRTISINAVGGFDTKFVFYGDDTDTAKNLAKIGRVVFDPDLIMPTSARRFNREGFANIQMKYLYNFIKVIFSRSKKPSME
jgi:glycosyltransferase involved in cell wall biosynthesis